MGTVLVTGGSGFIGRECLAPLEKLGFTVHTVSKGSFSQSKNHHQADLFNSDERQALLSSISPDVILHLAWDATPKLYRSSHLNLQWFKTTLALADEFKGDRFILAGTAAEYDWSTGLCTEGETALLPWTLYGATKFSLGEILSARFPHLSIATARLFSVYGPFEPSTRLVPSVTLKLLRGEPAPCPSGVQSRDFLYVKDMGSALAKLTASSVTGPVNIASGEALTLRNLLSAIGSELHREDLLNFGALPDAQADTPTLIASVARLQEEVGWKPSYSLQDSIKETVEFYRQLEELPPEGASN